MRRNPLYIFKDTNSTGIYDVPLKSTVHIVDAGDGFPMFIQLVAKTSINSTLEAASTIGDLLDDPLLYIDIAASGGSTSQLEAVLENGIPGWRILGRNPLYHGDTGNGAIDFSDSDIPQGSSDGNGALGDTSVASGMNTVAAGQFAFAAGLLSRAGGDISFASGEGTVASGRNTSTFGLATKMSNVNSTAIGQYNTGIVGAQEKTIFEVGVGADELNRGNALEVYLNGSILAPKLKLDGSSPISSLITKEYLDTALLGVSGYLQRIKEGGSTGYRILDKDSNHYGDIGEQAVDLSSTTLENSVIRGATGQYSFAEGFNTQANADMSHAEGNASVAKGIAAHSEGSGTLAEGAASHAEGTGSIATGDNAHAEGTGAMATGISSHAEGTGAIATGESAHAEGINTRASGISSHAEGDSTEAIGEDSHAEGNSTEAIGNSSHAEGWGTKATNHYMHASGIWNVGYPDQNIFEVGVGSSVQTLNGFEISLKNGSIPAGIVRAPQMTNAMIDEGFATGRVLITRDYLNANGGKSELQKISTLTPPGCGPAVPPGNLAGWRILGRDAANYNTIGCGAMDFSYSNISAGGGLGAHAANSFAEGVNTLATGIGSHAAGLGTIAGNDNQFVVGQYNENPSNSIFEVGIGTDTSPLSGLVVTTTGAILAPNFNSTFGVSTSGASVTAVVPDNALVTKAYVNTVSGSVSELESIEGIPTKWGWRLLGADIANYGLIGDHAVDFSNSLNPSSTRGATGVDSFATGRDTTASYENSFAAGKNTVAGSIRGFAAGLGTITDTDNQMVVGQYNAITGDSLFVVGGGADAVNLKNLLEVKDTGLVVAPSANTYAATGDEKALTTKDYVDTSMSTIDNLGDVDTTAPSAGDVLTWDDVNDVWFSDGIPAQATAVEQGGVAYKAGYIPGYIVGDVVVDNNIAYLCNITYDPSVDFATDVVNFTAIGTPEVAGKAWLNDTLYQIGDIVSQGNILYGADTQHISVWGDSVLGEPGIGSYWTAAKSAMAYTDLTDTPAKHGDGATNSERMLVSVYDSGSDTGEIVHRTIASGTGLVEVDDSGTKGWRLYNSSGDVANIGDDAIDFTTTGIVGAQGDRSVTFGNGTTATGTMSAAFGNGTTASGVASAAFGVGTTAGADNATAVGQYNDQTSGSELALFTVGVGTSGTKMNAFEVHPDNALEVGIRRMIAPMLDTPSIQAGGNKSLITAEFLQTTISNQSFMKNLIIDGEVGGVNQTGFGGTNPEWSALVYGDYCYDMWQFESGIDSSDALITQVIPAANYNPLWAYVLSYFASDDGTGSPGTVSFSTVDSTLTFVPNVIDTSNWDIKINGIIGIPWDATEVQLERDVNRLGDTARTSFEVIPYAMQLQRVQQYFWTANDLAIAGIGKFSDVSGLVRQVNITYPETIPGIITSASIVWDGGTSIGGIGIGGVAAVNQCITSALLEATVPDPADDFYLTSITIDRRL